MTTRGSHAADLVVWQDGTDRPRAFVLETRPVVVARDAQDPDAAWAEGGSARDRPVGVRQLTRALRLSPEARADSARRRDWTSYMPSILVAATDIRDAAATLVDKCPGVGFEPAHLDGV